MVLTDRSANDRSSSNSRTAVTMASRWRSPRLRRTAMGSAVMAVDHRIHGAPEQNLTCVKCALQDGISREFDHSPFERQERWMPTISTPEYLLDQAKRRLIPTLNNMPGMGVIEKRLRDRQWKQFALAQPPEGSDLKP